MKKLYFVILFAISSGSFAQVYHPIPTDSVWWVETSQGPYMGSLCIQTISTYIYPLGSANIHGQEYTKFHSRSVIQFMYFGSPPSTCPPQDGYYSDGVYAFIRNDSINKKVYMYDSSSTHADILLYDFDITIGDTITLFSGNNQFGCPYDTFTVANFDSVDIGGEYRKQYEIYSPTAMWGPIYLIEGIGSNLGFAFNNYCPFEYTSQLLCYHYKQFEYGNVGSTYCTQALQVDEHIQSTETYLIRTGPDHFQITNPYTSQINLHCYDILGKLIFSKSILQSEELSFSEVSSGVYVMYIEYNGQKLKPNKFLISH